MDTNFQVTAKTFQTLHSPLKQLKRNCVFTELYESRDGKLVKKRTFQTKGEWLTWRKQIIEELVIQRQLANEYPNNFLQIVDYSVDTFNHKRFLYITYDCDASSKSLFQYLDENTVNFEEQVKICDQLLQISCLLQKFNCQHTNLKPGNVIYYRNKVLLTDFGSARTHHQNFTKQYSNQKEKEWQNQLMFYCPKEYLDIMQEEDVDFRDDAWKQLNINDKIMRQKADKWAIGVMLIQVFENTQKQPNQINQFYGLNEDALNAKKKILETSSNGLVSGVVNELLINDSEPTKVYQQFQKFKQLINQKRNTQFQSEETHNFQQIFDKDDDEFKIERNQNGQQFYMDRKQIRELEQQYDRDDNSSVVSQQRPVIDCIEEYSVRNGENLVPRKSENLLFTSQQVAKFRPPREDSIFASQNVQQQVLYQDEQPDQNYKRPGLQKPSIVVTQPLQNRVPGQLLSEQNDEKTKLLNESRPQSSNLNISYEAQENQNIINVDDQQNDIENLVLNKNLGFQQFEIQAQAQLGDFVDPQNEDNNNNQLQSQKQFSSAQFKFQDSNLLNLQQVKEQTSHTNSGMVSFKNFQEFSEVQDYNKLTAIDQQLDKQNQNQLQRNTGQQSNLQVQQSQNLMQYTDLQQNKGITNSQGSLISFKNEPSTRNNNNVMNLIPVDDDFDQPQINQFQNQSAFFANSGNNLQPVNDNLAPPQFNLPPGSNINQNFSLNQFQPTNQIVDPSFLASKQSVFSVEQMPTNIAKASQLIVVKEDKSSPESKPQQPSQFKFYNENQQQLQLNLITNLNEQNQTPVNQIIEQKIQQENNSTQLQTVDDNEDQQKNQQQGSYIKAEIIQSGRFGQQLEEFKDVDQNKNNERKIVNPAQQLKEKQLPKLAHLPELKQPQVVQKIDRETQKIVDQIINPQDLKKLSDDELKKKLDSLEQIKQDIDEHQQNDPEEFQDKELNDTSKIINWNIDKLKKLDVNQVQQLEQQVDQQIIETKKKLQANQLFGKKKIIDNPSLLNMLDENQLNQLANQLEKQKDQNSQEFLKQVEQMQKVNQQLQKFLKDPKTGNLLRNEEIKLLNQYDLQKYNEQVKRLLEKTKQEQQRERLKEQLKEIQKQLDISKLDAKIQAFIDHPSVGNLLPQNIIDQLNPEQLQRYKNALEQQLPRAERLFKKEIEHQLNILKQLQQQQQQKQKQQQQKDDPNHMPEKIQKPSKNPGSNTSSFEDQNRIWRDELGCDEELFSLNKYIKAFQLNLKIVELKEQVPYNCQAILDNCRQDEKLKFQTQDIHPNKYQGNWLKEMPNGFGRMRDGKFSAIYDGIFVNGKFYWGSVIEMNEVGLITHYIGHYHEKYQVKNGKSKMVWYKSNYSFQEKKYQFVEYESFEGTFVLGKIQGVGKKKYSDKSVYEGEWKNNLREGKGKLTLIKSNTTIVYEGIFKNDLLEGEVTTIHNVAKDLKEIGNYVKGKPVGTHSLFLGNKKQKDLFY